MACLHYPTPKPIGLCTELYTQHRQRPRQCRCRFGQFKYTISGIGQYVNVVTSLIGHLPITIKISTSRIRSTTGRLCFHRCLSIYGEGGVPQSLVPGTPVPGPLVGRGGGGAACLLRFHAGGRRTFLYLQFSLDVYYTCYSFVRSPIFSTGIISLKETVAFKIRFWCVIARDTHCINLPLVPEPADAASEPP